VALFRSNHINASLMERIINLFKLQKHNNHRYTGQLAKPFA